MNFRKILILLFVLGSSFYSYGQRSLGAESTLGLAAFEDYQLGKYNDVIADLGEKEQLTANEELLLYLSEQQVGKSDGLDIQHWIGRNPNHPLKSLAHFKYAEYAFYKGDVNRARKHLGNVNSNELSETDRASHAFIAGFLNLRDREYSQAKKYFEVAASYDFQDEDRLTYYKAFSLYHLDDFDGAVAGFESSLNDPRHAISAKYFLAKIHLENEEYEKVISMAQEELSQKRSATNSGFYQLLGEAYALQGDVAKADAFFEQAINLHPGKPSAALYYQAGVSKFKLGNTDKALTFLTQSGIGSGPYAKLSAFQLGRLHIQRNEPEKALTAYMEASSSEDPEIKEESTYQSAKLNAKLERYANAINYSNDYLKIYPRGKWVEEIENLIALSYLKTSDYDMAITQLEQNGIRNATQKEVYQKVTYQKALQLFNDGSFDESVNYFKKSLRHAQDQSITNESQFYLGEINLRKGLLSEAEQAYSRMQPLTNEAHYGLGYALYNQRKYRQAISSFQQASGLADTRTRQDAQLRLADCYYATKAYAKALEQYQRLPSGDYVTFQLGMVYRNLDNQPQAAKNFDRVAGTSVYKDDAIFYKAQTAFENAQFQQAEAGFSSLINLYEKSNYRPAAFLNRAISRNNLGDLELAKDDYYHVLGNYIQREEAFSAVLGLQDLQQKGVAVGNLDQYIADYKEANPGDGSLEVVEFEAAKSTYFDLNYELAAGKLQAFLKEYPKSKFMAEASYYLGDAYYRADQPEEARDVFKKQRALRNNYTSRVLYRLGSINLELADYKQAREDFQQLLELNFTPKDNHNARNGLMLSSFRSAEYVSALRFADEIIDADWKPLNAEQTASMIKAKSLLELNRVEEGKTILETMAEGSDQFAAEASYMVAELAYAAGDYDESLDLLFDFTARLGSYTVWIEKAYLLISENYIAKDELFQAKATLRSIIQHSQNEETRLIASDRLAQIEEDAVSDSLSTVVSDTTMNDN